MTIRFFPFSRFTIYGDSMLPTLKPGQDILCFNWAYIFSQPKIGDIVVVKYGGREIIKCVQKCYGRSIFVMGDNKGESTDSRNFGPVSLKEIVGKVVYVR